MKILFFLTISICFLTSACVQASVETVSSNTVQSSQIYQIYTIETSRAKTEAVAAFRVGGATGTTLELNAPAKILYNKQPMPVSVPSNLIGTNYRMKGTDYRAGVENFQAVNEFSYTDAKGKNYVNSISIAPVEITTKGTIIFTNSKPTIVALSRAVGANETLTVGFDSPIGDEVPTQEKSVYLTDRRNAVVITPQYWRGKELNSQADLQIKIKKTETVASGTPLGGSISAVYSALPVSVNVKNPPKKKRHCVLKSAENKDQKLNLLIRLLRKTCDLI